MAGRQFLDTLNDSIKNGIIDNYGSLDNFYDFVYTLNKEDYRIYKDNDPDSQDRRQGIQMQLYGLETELENFGAYDGHLILTEISNDFNQVVLTNYLERMRPHSNEEILHAASQKTPPVQEVVKNSIVIQVTIDRVDYYVTYEKGVIGNIPGWIPRDITQF